jgi:hypothetical protein
MEVYTFDCRVPIRITTCTGQQIQEALNPGEKLGPSSKSTLDLLALPKFIKKIFSYFSRSSDPMSSQLYDAMHRKTIIEDRNNVAARDSYRAEWHRRRAWISF